MPGRVARDDEPVSVCSWRPVLATGFADGTQAPGVRPGSWRAGQVSAGDGAMIAAAPIPAAMQLTHSRAGLRL